MTIVYNITNKFNIYIYILKLLVIFSTQKSITLYLTIYLFSNGIYV